MSLMYLSKFVCDTGHNNQSVVVVSKFESYEWFINKDHTQVIEKICDYLNSG